MRFGLSESDLQQIFDSAKSIPEISQLILFGSRAKGTHKPGSDIDLAIKGKRVNYDIALRLSQILNEEIPLPYFFDVVDYAGLSEPRLIEHIDRLGVPVFERDDRAS